MPLWNIVAEFDLIRRAYRYGKNNLGLKGEDLSIKTQLARDWPEFYKIYKPDAPHPAKKQPLPKQQPMYSK